MNPLRGLGGKFQNYPPTGDFNFNKKTKTMLLRTFNNLFLTKKKLEAQLQNTKI